MPSGREANVHSLEGKTDGKSVSEATCLQRSSMPGNKEVIQATLWGRSITEYSPEPIKDLWVSDEFMKRLQLQLLQSSSL